MLRCSMRVVSRVHSSLFTIHYSLFTVLFCLSLFTTAAAQRDNFTPEEIELVRDAQEIDRRIEVLTQIIDRRFGALKIDVGGLKVSEKDSKKWGELAPSTRLELLLDIRRILQKAIDDIDSLAERPDSIVIEEPEKGKKPKTYQDLFPKAVRSLASAAERYRPALKTELDREPGNAEKGSILATLDSCDQIISAVAKLPAEVNPAVKKKN